jgi:hypothetical protein
LDQPIQGDGRRSPQSAQRPMHADHALSIMPAPTIAGRSADVDGKTGWLASPPAKVGARPAAPPALAGDTRPAAPSPLAGATGPTAPMLYSAGAWRCTGCNYPAQYAWEGSVPRYVDR